MSVVVLYLCLPDMLPCERHGFDPSSCLPPLLRFSELPSMSSPAAASGILVLGSETGLAVVGAAFKAQAPDLGIVRIGMDAAAPDAVLRDRVLWAIESHKPAAVFLASHALSLAVGQSLASLTDVPVHGLAVPFAESARLTCTRHVALLALPETFENPAIRRQMALYAERGLRVSPVSAADLVYMARRHLRSGALPDIMALRAMMDPVRTDARIDTVILSSCHALRLRGMLEKAAFRPFYWVDGISVSIRRFLELRADSMPVSGSVVRAI